MDFTIKKHKALLKALIQQNYSFQNFEEFIKNPLSKSIILRHDVDRLPKNSLAFAKIQAGLGIKGVYYFRAVPASRDISIIKEISALGHEIGYHYESLATCNGDAVKAIKDFERNLSELRKLVPVYTICMHGSPLSKYDSRDLWKLFDYRKYNVLGEPYFDINFSKVFYLTDTGRKWDGNAVSVRDKVNSTFKQIFHKTDEIIESANKGLLPEQIMFTFHPQRWNDNLFFWSMEYLAQNIKNIIKRYFFVKSNKPK